uniref:MFS domain-containing protein n=1 Tax=Strongyloides venezuelensis TaxID=75913 RepID=A0A0K0FDS3_STRVS
MDEIYNLSTFNLSILSSSFSFGQICGTAFFMLKNISNFTIKNAYTYTSGFLLFGSLLQSLSSYYMIVIGRVLLGIGTGIGFIINGITLTQNTNYQSRPTVFLIPSVMFSLGNLYPNVVLLLTNHYKITEYYLFIVSIPNILVTIYYFISGYKKIDILHEKDDDLRITVCEDINIPKKVYQFTVLLVLLNVSVGVPIIMAYSIEIFKFYGYSTETAICLSFFYPIIQIVFLSFMNIIGKSLTRFTLIFKGFILSFSLLFLITSILFLPPTTGSHTKTHILGTLTILLSMISSIPCSIIHCIYLEIFQSFHEHTKISSIARVYLWVFSFTVTFTFPILFSYFGLFIIFLIHLFITGISLSLLKHKYIAFLEPISNL